MNLFDLYAKISLDTSGYEQGLEEASGKTEGFASKLKSGLATAAKVGMAAIGAAAAGVAALTKASIANYAEYEQLVGGVETLFKTSADVVMEYAENAYKTAGMSANDYMNTVTSFSASLLQSLGGDTEAAAQKADLAITDMADNANKMGTAMEMIQNAYQGFAKQNYTMLDNLKLGYGGTKEEMERLLADAEKLSGLEFNIESYADVVDAIHIIQTEMGITGTTAKEASTTIQGSVMAMKAAWTNLSTGLADDTQNMDELIGNLVESAGTAAQNLLPRIQTVLSGIGELAVKLAPILAAAISTLVTDALPGLLTAGAQLIGGLAEGILSNAGTILQAGLDLVLMLANGISSGASSVVNALFEIIGMLGDWIQSNGGVIAEAAVALVVSLADAIISNLPALYGAVISIVEGIATGILTALPALTSKAPEIIKQLVNALKQSLAMVAETGPAILLELANGILSAIPSILEILPVLIETIVSYFAESLPIIANAGVQIFTGLVNGFVSAIPKIVAAIPRVISALVQAIPTIISAIVNTLSTTLPALIDGAIQLVMGIVSALPEIITSLIDALPTIIIMLVDTIIANAPMFIDAAFQIIVALVEALPELVVSLVDAVVRIVTSLVEAILKLAGKFAEVAKEWVKNLLDGIKSKWEDVKTWVNNTWDSIQNWFSGLWGSLVSIGKSVIDAIWDGLKSAWESVVSWFNGVWDSLFGQAEKNSSALASKSKGSSKGGGGKWSQQVVGSHALGLDYVPYDGYIAELHKGEMVVPAKAAEQIRNGGAASITVNQYIYSEAKTAADLMQEARYEQQRAVMMGV